MRQQALANRAEMARRRGEPGAIERFEEAIRLADELGNVQAQIESLLNLASAHVDAIELIEAEKCITKAEALLDWTERPNEVTGRIIAIRANLAWVHQDFDGALMLYLSAAEKSEGAERIQSQAAALLALARMRQRDRYRRLLGRLVTQGQQAKLDGVVAEALLPSAKEWLVAEAAGLSGRTYAEAIELALMQWLHDMPVEAEAVPDGAIGPSKGDATQVNESRMDPLVRVIVRMTADFAEVPTLQSKVLRQTITRLRRDLPREIYEIVIDWIEQGAAVHADINLDIHV